MFTHVETSHLACSRWRYPAAASCRSVAVWICTAFGCPVLFLQCALTGCDCLQGKNKRNFVQTFFLAVQEKGYFVLNDIFRYLPELPAQSTPTPADPSATPTQPPVENGYPTPAAPVHQSHAQVSEAYRCQNPAPHTSHK